MVFPNIVVFPTLTLLIDFRNRILTSLIETGRFMLQQAQLKAIGHLCDVSGESAIEDELVFDWISFCEDFFQDVKMMLQAT